MKKGLVSIVVPCSGEARNTNTLLESVLGQSYDKIETLVITNGSIKDSDFFAEKFEERGYSFRALLRDDTNKILEEASGEYIIWADERGLYSSPLSIDKMVSALSETDRAVSMARVQCTVLDVSGKAVGHHSVNENTKYKTDLFEDAVFGEDGFWFTAGSFIIKASAIDELIPDREIYTEKNAGQNFQLYLPLLYGHSCLTVEEFLYRIVAHEDSHSRNMSTNNERQKMYRRTIKNTLDKMPLDNGYKSYLMREVEEAVEKNSIYESKKLPLRRYAKMAVRGLLPHGVVVLYRRVFK